MSSRGKKPRLKMRTDHMCTRCRMGQFNDSKFRDSWPSESEGFLVLDTDEVNNVNELSGEDENNTTRVPAFRFNDTWPDLPSLVERECDFCSFMKHSLCDIDVFSYLEDLGINIYKLGDEWYSPVSIPITVDTSYLWEPASQNSKIGLDAFNIIVAFQQCSYLEKTELMEIRYDIAQCSGR